MTGVRAVTPFLREITIKPHDPVECRPGAYIQVHVPDYAYDAGRIDVPEHHREDRRALGASAQLVNDAPVRCCYSISVPVEQVDGQLSFLVRFMPGERPGRGCAYMYTLREGDQVRFSGPFLRAAQGRSAEADPAKTKNGSLVSERPVRVLHRCCRPYFPS